MVKTKKKKAYTAAEIFSRTICFITAAILIAGAAGMGMINLNFGDSLYTNINVSAILNNGLGAVLQTNLSPASLLTGIMVFIAVSVIFCIMLKAADIERGIIKTAATGAITGFILRCMAVFIWKLPQSSDFLAIYELSELLTDIPVGYWGRFLHELGTQYTGIWSAHMPFIIYQTVILKLGINPGLMNAFYGTASCIFTALAAKELFGKKAFTTAMLFMVFNPIAVLFTPIFSNQHPAMMFFTAAIWIAVKYKNMIGAAAGALILSAAQLIRPEMYVAVIGIAVYYVFLHCCGYNKRGIIMAAVFVAVFALSILLSDIAFRRGGMISGHIYNGNLKYKICVGLNRETGGSWSEADSLLLTDSASLDAVLRERLFQGGNMLLMFQKAVYQLGSYVYPWILNNAEHPMFSNLICRRGASAYMIIIAVLASLKLIGDKENRTRLFPVFIIIFGYSVVYALTEIQPRYNFMIIPLLTMTAADIQLKK